MPPPSQGNQPPPPTRRSPTSPAAKGAAQPEDFGVQRAFCGGCPEGAVQAACRGGFSRLGANKVHWECWSECNLACGFCYRSRGIPLQTADGERLMSAIATAGSRMVVFAGGDPALRADLAHLITYARSLGLKTEVHTNAQFAPERVKLALADVDCVGLSLDGPTEAIHDAVRRKPGNFRRVLALLGYLEQVGVPVIVRTVVARPNHAAVAEIGELLVDFDNVLAWYLLEFSPVGQGFDSHQAFELPRARFDEAVGQASLRYEGRLDVHTRHEEDKRGAYIMVTPDGDVYGTGADPVGGRYPRVGSVLREHLSDLAVRLDFRRERHEPRYVKVDWMLRRKLAQLGRPGEGFPPLHFQVQSPQKESSSGLT
jgi:MoaA/NifB/PqqE/SkfB family radical SAM enzyme